ncbi:hypothetical protein ACOMHN_006333 [Nucella lapillus]
MADDWEESIVFVELCGVASTHLFPSDSENGIQSAEILGLASERPLMQVNGHTFAGHYEDTMGTHLIMAGNKTNSTSGISGSHSSSRNVNYEYLCKADKKLVMHPAFLVDQTSSDKTGEGCAAETPVETIPLLREDPAEEPLEDPAEEPLEDPAEEPLEDPAEEPLEDPAEEPLEDPASDPVREPTSEPMREPANEPVIAPASEPAQQPASEPMREPASEPMREPASEPVQEPVSEHVREPAEQPAND